MNSYTVSTVICYSLHGPSCKRSVASCKASSPQCHLVRPFLILSNFFFRRSSSGCLCLLPRVRLIRHVGYDYSVDTKHDTVDI